MSFLLPSLPKEFHPSIPLSLGSADEVERTKHIILGIIIIGTGFMVLAPVLYPTQAIYLPPITQPERDYYTQKIHSYNQQLAQPFHTQEDHLQLADALANIGEREAAMDAYLRAMTDHATPHTH